MSDHLFSVPLFSWFHTVFNMLFSCEADTCCSLSFRNDCQEKRLETRSPSGDQSQGLLSMSFQFVVIFWRSHLLAACVDLRIGVGLRQPMTQATTLIQCWNSRLKVELEDFSLSHRYFCEHSRYKYSINNIRFLCSPCIYNSDTPHIDGGFLLMTHFIFLKNA